MLEPLLGGVLQVIRSSSTQRSVPARAGASLHRMTCAISSPTPSCLRARATPKDRYLRPGRLERRGDARNRELGPPADAVALRTPPPHPPASGAGASPVSFRVERDRNDPAERTAMTCPSSSPSDSTVGPWSATQGARMKTACIGSPKPSRVTSDSKLRIWREGVALACGYRAREWSRSSRIMPAQVASIGSPSAAAAGSAR